jgi:parvulin-like peptidyl-prolyl isomerase
MKFSYCAAALLCATISPALAQVASHAPTAMKTMVNTTASKPPSQEALGASEQVTGKAVARVNGSVLTDRDLLREMFAIFPYARVHNGFPKGEEADIRRGALEMIEYEELVYQEAERKKMTVSPVRLKQAEAAYRGKFQSDEDFKQFLKVEMNGSMDQLKRQVRRSLLIEDLLKVELDQKSKVSLAEARAYYVQNPKKFTHGEKFAFQSISIMPPDNSAADVKQKARQRADDALKQAKATKTPEEFGLLAEKISEDDFHVNMGDHKLVLRENLPPELVKDLLTMKPGQVSDVLQFGSFYTIVRLNAHVPAGKVKFEEVKDQLLSDLHKTKYDRLRADFDKRLRQQAKVEEL